MDKSVLLLTDETKIGEDDYRESLPLCRYCKGPFRNGSPWRGFFEPSTAPFRYERERVQTVSTKRRLIFNIGVNSNFHILIMTSEIIIIWTNLSKLCIMS